MCVCIKYLFNVYKDTKVICFYHFNFVFKKVKQNDFNTTSERA